MLLVAFGIAVANGRDWDAAVIGALALLPASLIGAWVFLRMRQ